MRGVIAVILACAVAVSVGRPTGHAQPDSGGDAHVDLDRARTEYVAAEKAMTAGDFNLATNHYANAYRASKDAALLYKIGVARQKAGDCLNAGRLFAIYLRLGKPSDDFLALTRDRMRACGVDPDRDPGPSPADPVAGWGTRIGPGPGSATGTGSGPGIGTVPGSGSETGPGSATGPATGSGSATGPATGSGTGAGSADPSSGAGSGSATPKLQPPRHRAAWLLVGGAIAAATVGAVLAYSANAAEADLQDLYVGLGGSPPTFNAQTKKTFDDLVKEGERYQTLSIASFGLAAILGGIAAYRFVTAEKPRVQITPTATPTGAGVSATVRF